MIPRAPTPFRIPQPVTNVGRLIRMLVAPSVALAAAVWPAAAAVPEVTGLRFAPDALEWNDEPTASEFHVYPPLYIWRNVFGFNNRKGPETCTGTTDSDPRGRAFKTGYMGGVGGGRVYIYHNTILHAPPPFGLTDPLGVDDGILTGASSGKADNMVSRNNIVYARDDALQAGGGNDYDHDMYWGDVPGGAEPHGVRAIRSTRRASTIWLPSAPAGTPACSCPTSATGSRGPLPTSAPTKGVRRRSSSVSMPTVEPNRGQGWTTRKFVGVLGDPSPSTCKGTRTRNASSRSVPMLVVQMKY